MFQNSQILKISPRWVLRNDYNYLLLYLRSTTESKNWILNPIQSFVISLIDGNTNYEDLILQLGRVLSVEKKHAKRIFDDHIRVFNKDETIISNSNTSEESRFLTEDYYIDINKYQVPSNSRLRLPTKIGLFVSKKCMADCIYCYADRRIHPNDSEMSYQEWIDIIDTCTDQQIYNLDILGGDPIADIKAFNIVLYLLSKGIETYLSTKCELTEKLILSLMEHGFGEETVSGSHTLQISIDSVDPYRADLLSGTHGFLKRCERSVDNCIRFGIRPRIKTVLTSINAYDIEKIVSYFSQRGVRDFHFVQYGISHFKYREDLYLDNDQKKKIHEIALDINERFHGTKIIIQDELPSITTNIVEEKIAWEKRARCTGGYSSMVITPTGDIIPCEQMPQKPPYILSNIKNKNVKDAWNDPRFDDFLFPDRSRFCGTVCEYCDEFDECHFDAGFCYRDSFLAYETVYEAPPNCPRQNKQGRKLI